MMSNNLALSTNYGLSNLSLSYSKTSNTHVTKAHTSEAGNTYFSSLRITDGILIKEDIGQGYKYGFLNEIKIYSKTAKKLITSRSYHKVIYSQEYMKSQVEIMLFETLKDESQQKGTYFNQFEAKKIVDHLLIIAFNEDQRRVINNPSTKYLM